MPIQLLVNSSGKELPMEISAFNFVYDSKLSLSTYMYKFIKLILFPSPTIAVETFPFIKKVAHILQQLLLISTCQKTLEHAWCY